MIENTLGVMFDSLFGAMFGSSASNAASSGSGIYVVWLAAVAGGVVALRLVLTGAGGTSSAYRSSSANQHYPQARGPQAQARPSQVGPSELASLGLGPSLIGTITAFATLLTAICTAIYVWQQRTVFATGTGGASAQTAVASAQTIAEVTAWLLLIVVVIPKLLPRVMRFVVAQRYVRRRDAAVLLWMRRIRLLVASGQPTNAAALSAAEQVREPAFKPLAGAINLAVTTGRDPLAAAATKLQGSEAASLLGTVNATERSGAAASELIDKVLQRVLRSLDAQRRERMDRLARTGATTASVVAVLAGVVVVLMVVTTLPST